MDFGISFLPDIGPEQKTPERYLADAIHLSIRAEELGLSRVKMTEHYGSYYGGYCPSPLSFLAAVSTRTKSIRLMTGGIQASFNHPMQIASTAAMIDCLSGGRLDVGFVRAYLPFEFDIFGIDLDESRVRYQKNILKVIALWRDDIGGNAFGDYCIPRPLQKPHPPVWCAAVRSRESFAWIGEQGFGLLVTPSPGADSDLPEMIDIYRSEFVQREGGALPGPTVAISMPLCISDQSKNAALLCDEHMERYMATWRAASMSWRGRQSAAYPGYQGLTAALDHTSPREMRNAKKVIAGSPDVAAAIFAELQGQLQIDHWLWQVDFGGMAKESAERTLELFAREVLPKFQEKARGRQDDSKFRL